MSKDKTPKFREKDDRNTTKKRKSNRPTEPYVRSEKHRKTHWEDYIDEQEWEEED